MKTESIVLSIIGILVGLFVAGTAFYFFQVSQKKPEEKKHVISIQPTPTQASHDSFLTITAPEDEGVSMAKSVKLTGKAPAGSTVVIATEDGQDVVSVEEDGAFTSSLSLDDGVNLISITATKPNGVTDSQTRTITYSTENF
jgi:hypothetical protein